MNQHANTAAAAAVEASKQSGLPAQNLTRAKKPCSMTRDVVKGIPIKLAIKCWSATAMAC